MDNNDNRQVVNNAIEYIFHNIKQEITIDMIAQHCHLSKYYFCRIFKQETKESVYSFIKRIRMEQSALHIKMERERSLTDIGLDYGYSSSNYSTAFKNVLNESPISFKNRQNSTFDKDCFDRINSSVYIENIKDQKVIYERIIGNYNDYPSEWGRFINKYRAFITKDTTFYESSYDDPAITAENHCLFDIYMSLPTDYTGQNIHLLKGGRYLIYPFKGDKAGIIQANYDLRNKWFPFTEYQLADGMCFDRYTYVDRDINPQYMELDICIPIK